jgi:hypothetical protein
MDEVQGTATSMESKYREWSKVLIEPAALNDARLYSLEARAKAEENLRLNEFTTIRELLLKLIFSLVQRGENRDKTVSDKTDAKAEKLICNL